MVVAAGSEKPDPSKLLASPHVTHTQPDPGEALLDTASERHQLTPAVKGVGDDRPYVNEPPRDFAHEAVRTAFQTAIETTTVPDQPVDATNDDTEKALATAHKAFPSWRDEDPRARARVLTQAAAIMRARRDELTAVIVHENGKGWRDADAETCEAIDFCEFYAREAIQLFEEQRLGEYVGEHNALIHEGRGLRCHRTVELPFGDLVWHVSRRLGHGQPRSYEASRANHGDRPDALRHPA